MTRIQLVLLLILVLNTISYSQQETINSEIQNYQTKEWKTFSEDNFEIQYPSTWELSENNELGLSFILLSPAISETDEFQENVNLLVQDLSEYDLNLADYVTLSESQIKTLISEGNIISSDTQRNADGEFQRVIFTGNQGILNLKFEQIYWVTDKKAYVLTLTCKEDEFDNYKELGEEIIASFDIK